MLALLVLAVAARGGRADEEKTPLDLLREQHPKLDTDKIVEMGWKAKDRSDADLAADDALLDRTHDRMMEKWKKIQLYRWTHMKVTNDALLQSARLTFTLASYEMERKERIERIEDRDNAGFHAQFPGPFPTKRDVEIARAQWDSTPEHKKALEDLAGVQKWFTWAIADEVKRARSGQTHQMDTLDELTQECQDEAFALSGARRSIKRELARRRGDKEGQTEAERKAEEEERARHGLHVAPIRTEHEGRTGEPVEAWFRIWKGAAPYLATLHAPGSGFVPLPTKVAEAGDVAFSLSYAKPGTYTATVSVMDDQSAVVESAPITITVTGEPLSKQAKAEGPPKPKPPGGGSPPPGSGTPPPAPQPIAGTFQAMTFHLNAGLARHDVTMDDKDGLSITGVPATITIDASGNITGSARYVMGPDEVRPHRDFQRITWTSSFDLAGHVDWASGVTQLELTNGHDENGYERDQMKTDDAGKVVGLFGHWREFRRVAYSATFSGWTLPGPQAAAWLVRLGSNPQIVTALKTFDVEKLGVPRILLSPEGTLAFDARGFFGMTPLGGKAAADDPPFERRRVTSYLWHNGYDKMNAQDHDETAREQERYDKRAAKNDGGWYVKLLGLAPDSPPAGEAKKPAADPRGDLVAFGLWPTKPIEVPVGGKARPRAMGVFSEDFGDAVNLSDTATWKASDGLTRNADGSFSAEKPGTYTVTATSPGGMTSTLTVVVTAR